MLPVTTLNSTARAMAHAATPATSVVGDALTHGQLLRSQPAQALDHLEQVLAHGQVDPLSAISVGGGVNGRRFRMLLDDPAQPGTKLWAVRKPAEAQAAQEEFSWKLGRELGVDHLMPAVARRADGAAWIEYKPGGSLSAGGITNTAALDGALERSYAADAVLQLGAQDAALAARTDRQLLQVLDYVLANSDRHLGNGLYDARTGALSFIDYGHMGRGTALDGASRLSPGLREFQAGNAGGEVKIDAPVLDYIRARLTPDRIRALHAETFHAPGIETPKAGSMGARMFGQVNGPAFREGIVARLDQVLQHGSYRHVVADGDVITDLEDPGAVLERAVGLNEVRRAMMALDGF
ncbi:MAG: hypothetical protein JWM25_1500 [Thermoleophilia bacterium]|nr:hypothetical protein [Thermoleophilia bacterium]